MQVKLHLDGRLHVPLGNEPEVLDDWPLHKAKQVHSTRLYVGACWQGKLINKPSDVVYPLSCNHKSSAMKSTLQLNPLKDRGYTLPSRSNLHF